MVASHRNLAYGPDPRHRIDVYQPDTEGHAPVVIFLHGGGWRSGSRNHYRILGKSLAGQGILTAIPDYHLFPQACFPKFNEDAALACHWMRQNAMRFGGQDKPLCLIGHSAGAHIGALLCLDPAYLADSERQQISKFIGLAGPYSSDLSKIERTAPIFAGATDPDRTRPIKLVSRTDRLPAMLLLHGAKDRTVGLHNSTNMASALADAGGRVETKSYPNLGHISLLTTIMPGLRWRAPVWRDLLDFLRPASS